MKKLFLGMAGIALLFTSCEKDQSETLNVDTQEKVDMSDFYAYTDVSLDQETKAAEFGKNCYTMKNLNRLLNENPGLYKKMYNEEYHTRSVIAKSSTTGKGKPGSGGGTTPPPPTDNLGIINIPVNVIVVYSNTQQNISDAQIQSQIAVLNNDFRATNSDKSNTPSEFAGVIADSEVTFTLAGVSRHSDATTQWGTNDAVKYKYPPLNPATTLNIWVCNIGGGILGYAQFPGGPAATDGVVIGPQYFGNSGYVEVPYDKGRTASHEIGHYLNLRHIWGDGRCRQDDFVADTPSSDGPNYGCPAYPTVNCQSADMTMNYMDYVYDQCMYMFTEGQKARMRAIFTSGGARETMAL